MRSFNSSAIRFEKGPVDVLHSADAELLDVLNSEIALEQSSEPQVPQLVDSFLKTSGFNLKVTDGVDEVELVKKEGDETIHVFFSISDAQHTSEAEIEGQKEIDDIERPPTGNSAAQHEAAEEESFEFSEDDFDNITRLNIVVEKPNGALAIEGAVQGDTLVLETLVPYSNAQEALADTAEADYTRSSKYRGPPVALLDPSLQGALEAYLNARGLGENFADFVVEFACYRENKEYLQWLKRVQNFIAGKAL